MDLTHSYPSTHLVTRKCSSKYMAAKPGFVVPYLLLMAVSSRSKSGLTRISGDTAGPATVQVQYVLIEICASLRLRLSSLHKSSGTRVRISSALQTARKARE